MTLKQKGKEMLSVWAVVLAYLHIVRCDIVEDDICEVQTYYWHMKKLCIEKRVDIRRSFCEYVEILKPKELKEKNDISCLVNGKIAEGKRVYAKMETMWKDFKEKEEQISNIIDNKIKDYHEKMHRNYLIHSESAKIESMRIDKETEAELNLLFYPAYKLSLSLVKQIHMFDSYMLAVLEEYSKKISKDSNLSELTLFRLAKNKKVVAAELIYYLYNLDMAKKDNDLRSILEHIGCTVLKHNVWVNMSPFTDAVEKDVAENSLTPLASADKQLHLLLNQNKYACIMNEETMSMYLDLIDPDISDEEKIEQYKDITFMQVLSAIMIENLMVGRLLDFKSNRVFSVLGKIIENIFEIEIENKERRIKAIEIESARYKQNRMLNALSCMWLFLSSENFNISGLAYFQDFCKINNLPENLLYRIRCIFNGLRWVLYILNNNPKEQGTANKDLVKEMHFDAFYVCPIWYICRRYGNTSSLITLPPTPNKAQFLEMHGNRCVLRPYMINKKNANSAEQLANIRTCINLWLERFPSFEIIHREEDGEEYQNMARDFFDYLKKSSYLQPTKITETKIEGEGEESSQSKVSEVRKKKSFDRWLK
ncbi:hypothetical protein NEMIN01_0363 [Nematocida minor]|uniref:uncharacterized protein n=1 Tax=Nematocida minor TaxID=1912983 RepID=UPI00221F0B40|nr:uncharacterized protein NEMIN01_0363 [Nematocida minor]KAI5189197.1 hypothetical protein NEMIN01_0363 [Nematocida minor]